MSVKRGDWINELGNARVRFWVCPIREHRNRNDNRGWPVATVEWRGDIAHCTAPGCGRTSDDRSAEARSTTTEETPDAR